MGKGIAGVLVERGAIVNVSANPRKFSIIDHAPEP